MRSSEAELARGRERRATLGPIAKAAGTVRALHAWVERQEVTAPQWINIPSATHAPVGQLDGANHCQRRGGCKYVHTPREKGDKKAYLHFDLSNRYEPGGIATKAYVVPVSGPGSAAKARARLLEILGAEPPQRTRKETRAELRSSKASGFSIELFEPRDAALAGAGTVKAEQLDLAGLERVESELASRLRKLGTEGRDATAELAQFDKREKELTEQLKALRAQYEPARSAAARTNERRQAMRDQGQKRLAPSQAKIRAAEAALAKARQDAERARRANREHDRKQAEEAARAAKEATSEDAEAAPRGPERRFDRVLGKLPSDGPLDVNGELGIEHFQAGETHLANVTVRYRMSVLMGEPIHKFSVAWKRGANPKKIHSFKFRARVLTTLGDDDAPIYITFSPDLVEAPGKGFGWSMAGSPMWNRTFTTGGGTPLSAADAKAVVKGGFRLANLEVIAIDNKPPG
jgi:hypothetical protein